MVAWKNRNAKPVTGLQKMFVRRKLTALFHAAIDTYRTYQFRIIETKPFYTNVSRQMKLVSDFSWIPFEELKYLKDDIRENMPVIIEHLESDAEYLESLAYVIQRFHKAGYSL